MTLLLDRWGARGGGGPFPFSANTKTTQLTKPNCNACSNSLPFSHIHTITPTGTNTHACWSLKHTHWKTQQVVSVCVSVCAYSAHRTYSLTQAGMHIKTHTHIYTLAKPRLYIGLLYWQSKYCYWITIQGWLVCVLWVWKRRPTALCRHVCVCVFLNSYGYEDQMSSHKDRQNDEILPVLTSTQSQATISVYRFKVRI